MIREFKGQSLLHMLSSYVVIDIETTGLDFDYCHIIEISALKVDNSVIVDRFSSLVHLPSHECLDDFITVLTGITDEMLSTAPDLQTVITGFFAFVSDYTLVGHNVNFDVNFLYDACLKTLGKPLSNNFVDTMRISRRLFREEPHHRLENSCAFCGIYYRGAHRADADCELTFACYEKYKALILEQYSSFEEWTQKCSKHKSLDVKSITSAMTEFDEDHPLFNKTVVFTGALSRYTRKEAMQMVVDVGGLVAAGLTKLTDYLVVGSFDFVHSVKDGKSEKIKKAEKLKLAGNDVEVISENAFFDLLNGN